MSASMMEQACRLIGLRKSASDADANWYQTFLSESSENFLQEPQSEA